MVGTTGNDGRGLTPPTDGEVIGACPLDCPDGCSWIVTVEDGRAVSLRGNPDHPFTRGGLCKKVNPWLDYAAEPGRLLYPLRRTAPKGPTPDGSAPEDVFERITWDEALGEIAERFRAIIDRSGPAAIWPFAGTGNVGLLQGGGLPSGSRLWNHLGVSGSQITICSISGHVGLGYSTGTATGFDPEDLPSAGTVLIWGSNTLVSNRHLWPFVEEASAAGAPVIVVDPVRTRTAARADHHIAPRVGTDGALALGLCRALIDLDAVDHRFLDDRTDGYELFRESIEEWTPDRTAQVCGIEAAQVTWLAETVAARSPLAIKLGQGMQRHAQGGQTSRIISCIPALLGSYGQVGGGLVYSTAGPYGFNTALAGGAALGARPRWLATTNLAANLVFDSASNSASHRQSETGSSSPAPPVLEPPVEALFVYGANPMVSNPDIESVRSGLSRPDLFTVAVDIVHTETTDYADIVLPSTMQHEQFEVNDSFSHLYVNLNQPAVEPPGECLPHTEIFRRLAAAMDLSEPALYADDLELARALLDTPAFAEAGITVESLQKTGWARLPNTDRPYVPFARSFPTPSGRFEFASQKAEQENQGLVPYYRPPDEAGGGKRPVDAVDGPGRKNGSVGGGYDLVAAASDWHINSVFAGTAKTLSRTGRPSVVVHPDDAARDGLVAGGRVLVSNGRGGFEAELTVTDTVRPGVAMTTKGWWGMGVNATVAERDSDMGRGAVYHDNVVSISAVSATTVEVLG